MMQHIVHSKRSLVCTDTRRLDSKSEKKALDICQKSHINLGNFCLFFDVSGH